MIYYKIVIETPEREDYQFLNVEMVAPDDQTIIEIGKFLSNKLKGRLIEITTRETRKIYGIPEHKFDS